MIENALVREMRREVAPAELWVRIQNPPEKQRRAVMVVAVVAIVAMVWMARGNKAGAAGNEAVALRAVDRGAELQFRSHQGSKIRAWVQSETGLDVPLSNSADSLEPQGARLVGDAVEVVYERRVVLVVARSVGADHPKHWSTPVGARSVAWTSHGVQFALACADPVDFKAACTLCHANGA